MERLLRPFSMMIQRLFCQDSPRLRFLQRFPRVGARLQLQRVTLKLNLQ